MSNYQIQAVLADWGIARMDAALAKLADKHGFMFNSEEHIIEIPPNTDIAAFVWDLKRVITGLAGAPYVEEVEKQEKVQQGLAMYGLVGDHEQRLPYARDRREADEATIRNLREENKLLSEDNIKLREDYRGANEENILLKEVINDIGNAAGRLGDVIENAADLLSN